MVRINACVALRACDAQLGFHFPYLPFTPIPSGKLLIPPFSPKDSSGPHTARDLGAPTSTLFFLDQSWDGIPAQRVRSTQS